MKVDIKEISKTKKKIKLEVPASEVDQAFKDAYNQVRKKAQVKGFRTGKVPDNMLDKFYAVDVHQESISLLVERTYGKVLQENEIFPIIQPKFNLSPLVKSKNYSYDVEVEVKHKIDVQNYLEIPLKKRNVQITEEEINAELKRLQESKADLKPAEGRDTVEKGLMATIDFEGTINGKPFTGGNAKGFVFEYGIGYFLPEFEEKIKGMKLQEERTINITFPNNYHQKDLADKKAEFKVLLQALHVKALPNLDDEFAKDIGKESLKVVKDEIEQMLTKRKERAFREEYAGDALDYLIKKNKVEIPEGLIEGMMKNSKKSKEENLKSLQTEFILEAIGQKESIQVETKDVEARFKQLAMMYRQPIDAIKKHYQEKKLIPQLIHQIGLEKTLDFVIDKAKVK